MAVAEYGSFTEAGEALGLSKASLSQQVTQLELLLGVQLFYRTTRKLRLSDVGAQYLEQCKAGVKILKDASDLASQATDALAGTVRLNSVGGLLGEEVVAPLAIEFQRINPAIEVEFDFSSIREDLLESNYDLVLRMGDLEDSTLIARRLHTITTRYVASMPYLEEAPHIEHPNDLKQAALISGSVSEWSFAAKGKDITVQAGNGFRIANGRVMMQAALSGLGVARLSDLYVDKALQEGRLREVLGNWAQTTPLWLVSPPTRHQLTRVRSLMTFMVERFATQYEKVKAGDRSS